MRLLALVGGAPRGECDGSVSSKSKSFAPRAGLLQRSQRAAALLLWEPRPAANAEVLSAQKQKLRPEGGPPTEESKRHPRRLLWEARPAAEAIVLSAQKQKLRPEVGAPTEEPKRRPRRFFLWEARPAANAEVLPAQKPSFAPRSGLLQKSQSAARAVFCGRRAPRRMLRSVSSKAKASPRGRASYRRTKSAARVALWEPRPRGECGGSACPKAQSFAPRSGLLHPHGECRRCQLNGNSSARGSAPHRMP